MFQPCNECITYPYFSKIQMHRYQKLMQKYCQWCQWCKDPLKLYPLAASIFTFFTGLFVWGGTWGLHATDCWAMGWSTVALNRCSPYHIHINLTPYWNRQKCRKKRSVQVLDIMQGTLYSKTILNNNLIMFTHAWFQ